MKPFAFALALAALTASAAPARADDVERKVLNEVFAHKDGFSFIYDIGLAEVECGKLNLTGAADKYASVVDRMGKAFGPNHLALAGPLQNRGMILQRLRRFEEAEKDFRAAVEITDAALKGKHRLCAKPMVNLTGLLLETGRPQEAERLLDRAVAMYADGKWPDDDILACAHHNRGLLHLSMGRPARALEAIDHALPIARKYCGRNSLEAGNGLQSRAAALIVLKRNAEAVKALEEAVAVYVALAPQAGIELANAHTALGWVYLRDGRPDDARKAFERADATAAGVAKVAPDMQNLARVARDELALFRADWDGLEKRFAARPPAARGFGTWVDFVDRHHHAQFHAYRARWDKATDHFDAICRELYALNASTLPGLTELEQLGYAGALAKVRDGGLSLAVARPDDPAVAAATAAWAVNLKNLPLRVAAAQQRLRAADGERPFRQLAIRAQAAELNRARAELAGLAFARPVGPVPAADKLGARFEALLAEEADAAGRLARLMGDRVSVPKWVPLADVRAGLAPTGTALVEFVRSDVLDYREPVGKDGLKRTTQARYLAWVVPPAPAAVRFFDLGPAEAIDSATEAVLTHADGVTGRTDLAKDEPLFREKLAALSKVVLDPLYPALKGYERWAVCPDAALWLVPWAALPAAGGAVVERHAVRVLVAGADARDLGRPKLNFGAGGPAVVLADPDFDLNLGTGPRTGPALRRPDGFADAVAALRATRQDADAAVRGLTKLTGRAPVRLTGGDATEARLRVSDAPTVLVASTHAFAVGGSAEDGARGVTVAPFGVQPLVSPPPEGGHRNPLRGAGLILAGYNTALARDGVTWENDGILHALDIPALNFDKTELVLLPCCATGRGAVYADGGVASLCTAFGVAGARTVGGTLWRVRDDATADLVSAFFDELARSPDPAEALALAQRARLAALRKAGTTAHPFLWAGFFVTGPQQHSGG